MCFAQTILVHSHSFIEADFGYHEYTTILIFSVVICVLERYEYQVLDITLLYVSYV